MYDYYDSFDCEVQCEEYYDEEFDVTLSLEDEEELNVLFG